MKVTRDAFLYLPAGDGDKQCGSCWLYRLPIRRCAVLGPEVPVAKGDSCDYWGPGPGDDRIRIIARFTPEEVGFVRRPVRCENCKFFSGNSCGLYHALNKTFPQMFDLDVMVEAKGCCNAQTPGGSR